MSASVPKGWRKEMLGNLCDVCRGSSPRPIADQRYFVAGEIPWIKIADATKSGKYLYETKEHVNELGASFSRQLPKGSLIIAASGTLGHPQFLGVEGCAHDGWLIPSNFRGIDRHFLYYLFLWKKEFFYSSAYGAAIQNINTMILREMEVVIPDITTQERIAAVLSAYDDLIENNTRRIQILEQMAQALYREWFVNFRFPGHANVKLVDSPAGKIPQGWNFARLGDVVVHKKEATTVGKHLKGRSYVPIDCLPQKSLALLDARPVEEAQSSLQLFESGDILFGAMRPYFHKVAIAPLPGVTRTTCFVLKPRQAQWFSFAVLTMFQEDTIKFATAHSQGATIPYVAWDGSLADMPVLIPTAEISVRFDNIVSPMLLWIRQSFLRMRNLRRTRDLLLPRLISGALDVSELKIETA